MVLAGCLGARHAVSGWLGPEWDAGYLVSSNLPLLVRRSRYSWPSCSITNSLLVAISMLKAMRGRPSPAGTICGRRGAGVVEVSVTSGFAR